MNNDTTPQKQCGDDCAALNGLVASGFASCPTTTIGQGKFRSFSRALLIGGVAMLGSVSAHAVFTYTYSPPAPDLSDLDHHNAYSWVLSGLDTTKTYTSASLTITNINNWDLTKNILFIHLFDTALTTPAAGGSILATGSGGNNLVTTYQDVDINQSPVVDLSDAFGASSLTANPLVKQSNKSNIMLGTYVDGSYSGAGTVIDGVTVPNFQTGTYTPPPTPNAAQTVTYNFNALQLQKLNEYITGGDAGRIAFGFDSDCHFYNDGIQFTMISDVVQTPPIPEPSTMLAGAACMMPMLRSVFGRRRRS